MDFADKLNELSALIEDSEVDAILAHLRATLPEAAASKDTENTLRIVLSMILVHMLESASKEEKNIFLSNITNEVFGGESTSRVELSIPDNFEGEEVMRVFEETKDHTKTGEFLIAVKPTAMTPGSWGIILHDVATNIAAGLVENGVIEPGQRKRALDTIANGFQSEHRRTPDPGIPGTNLN